jgi:hypothetical protein
LRFGLSYFEQENRDLSVVSDVVACCFPVSGVARAVGVGVSESFAA